MLNKFLGLFSKDVAIDLGTANSLVYVKGEGIVLSEPSVVAINKKTGQILAIGNEAKKMVGRTPAHVIATRPLANGVVFDFEATEQILKYFIEEVHKKSFFSISHPRIIIGVPSAITEVERKAVSDATKYAGAREVFLIEQPMASAIGAKLQIQEPGGNFIIDIGGGTTDIAVISLGGIVVDRSLKIAGDKLNQDIIDYVQEEYNLLIGERSAEEIKINIGSVLPLKEKKEASIRGRNLVTGLPEEIILNQDDIKNAIEKSIKQIIEAVKITIEETPPELISDIMKKGIFLTGGGGLLRGLDQLISKETKIPVKLVEDPLTAVVRGAGVVLENLDELREVLVDMDYGEIPKV